MEEATSEQRSEHSERACCLISGRKCFKQKESQIQRPRGRNTFAVLEEHRGGQVTGVDGVKEEASDPGSCVIWWMKFISVMYI